MNGSTRGVRVAFFGVIALLTSLVFAVPAGAQGAPSADLEVTATVDNPTKKSGRNLNFTIVVTNNGPDAAANVAVDFPLDPDELEFTRARETQGNYDENTGVWTVGSLASGESATMELRAVIEANDGDTIIVTSTGSSTTPDPDPSNNAASITILVDGRLADIEITKTVDNPAPSEGDTVVFTIVASNIGPQTERNLEVTDLLPAGLSFVSASATKGNFTNPVWDVNRLRRFTSETLTITATVDAGTAGSTITNIASVSSRQSLDPDPSNDSGQASLTVASPLAAADDTSYGIVLEAGTHDVAANDLGVPPGAVFSLTGTGTAVGPASIDPATGIVTYTPDPFEVELTVTLDYEVCPNGVPSGSPGCDTATLSITVVDAAAIAFDDFGAGIIDVTTPYNVGLNDVAPDGPTFYLTGGGTAAGMATIDTFTGILTYTPVIGEEDAIVSVEYEICPPPVGPGAPVCDFGILDIYIDPLLIAVPDMGTGQVGVSADYNVGLNDLNVPDGSDYTLTGIGSALGPVTINGLTAVITYTPIIGEEGLSVTVEYEVCPDGAPQGGAACDTADLTVTVDP